MTGCWWLSDVCEPRPPGGGYSVGCAARTLRPFIELLALCKFLLSRVRKFEIGKCAKFRFAAENLKTKSTKRKHNWRSFTGMVACSRLRDSGETANWENDCEKTHPPPLFPQIPRASNYRVPFLFALTLLSESLEQVSGMVTLYHFSNKLKLPIISIKAKAFVSMVTPWNKF